MAAVDPKRPFDNPRSMKRNRIRIAAGLITSAAIFLLLDQLIAVATPDLAIALAQMALLAFIAFAIGGLIATSDFVFPAAIFAALTWLAVAGYSIYIGLSLGNPIWDHFVWNLPSSVLIPAVAVGAKVGTSAAARLAPPSMT